MWQSCPILGEREGATTTSGGSTHQGLPPTQKKIWVPPPDTCVPPDIFFVMQYADNIQVFVHYSLLHCVVTLVIISHYIKHYPSIGPLSSPMGEGEILPSSVIYRVDSPGWDLDLIWTLNNYYTAAPNSWVVPKLHQPQTVATCAADVHTYIWREGGQNVLNRRVKLSWS